MKSLRILKLIIMKLKIDFFNGHENFTLVNVNLTGEDATKTLRDEERKGTWRLTTHYTDAGVNIYSFGFLTDDLNSRPDHGGEWSSRCEIINKVFNENLTECGVNSWAASVDVQDLLRIRKEQNPFTCVIMLNDGDQLV
jgi:hypothetical protein